MKIAFETLGCKVNQFDTAAMREQAVAAGREIVPFGGEADVYVINTCSVTAGGGRESRRIIRAALRRNPGAKIIVTGCHAQTHPEELMRIPGVDWVLGTQERDSWLDYLGGCDKALGPRAAADTDFSNATVDPPLVRHFGDRTRGFVKVQDGCDARCSFCLIPRARGGGRSVAYDRIIEQIRWMADAGMKEAVLTGVNLGCYGRDVRPKGSLARLLGGILRETRIPRIRISSVEPKTVTRDLLATMAASDRICRHLHIPLQSGCDRILKRMNRHYTSGFYRKLIRSAHEAIPGINIGCDVMVGFPGEGEREFGETARLLADLPISYFHVFPFSPRPKTEAADMAPAVQEAEKNRRTLKLRTLSERNKKVFNELFVGRRLRVLVENERDRDSGLLRGYTDNYIRVLIDGPDTLAGALIPAELRSAPLGITGLPA